MLFSSTTVAITDGTGCKWQKLLIQWATNNTNIDTINENETAAAFLPASLFRNITDRENIGSFYSVYNMGRLFPITNTAQATNASFTTIVGSPVFATTIGSGLNFSGLVDPVRILLRFNEMEVGGRSV